MKKSISLNENQLREFISYSVSKILREGYGRPIYDRHGELDGYEGDEMPNDYGTIELELSDESLMRALQEVAGITFDDTFKQKFMGKFNKMPDEGDFVDYMMRTIDFDGIVNIELDFDSDYDMGDRDTPPSGSINLKSWKINPDCQYFNKASEIGKKIMKLATEYEMEHMDEDNLYTMLNEEKNMAIMFHSDGTSHEEPKSKYEGMTYEEYCEAKAREQEEDRRRIEDDERPSDKRPNRGIMYHSGKMPGERTPEEMERDEHMFDDDYWVKKGKGLHISESQLKKIIKKTISEKVDTSRVGEGLVAHYKILNVMQWIMHEMADIENRYEAAEVDPRKHPSYNVFEEMYDKLKEFNEYCEENRLYS